MTVARPNTTAPASRRVEPRDTIAAAIKALVVVAYLALAAVAANDLSAAARGPGDVPWTTLAAKLSVVLFLTTIAAAVLVRSPPVAVSRGLRPRLDAAVGAFLLLPLGAFPHVEVGSGLHLLAATLLICGNAAAVGCLCNLGRSFSIMPEARRLVMAGAYRFVRHPVYLAEQIAIAGLLIEFASWPSAALVAAQLLFQIRRMRNEEAVLRAAFPEYADYARRTPRLVPYLW